MTCWWFNITPKARPELTAEREAYPRAIFKEKARESAQDTSLKVPHGEKGVVIDVKEFFLRARTATTSHRESTACAGVMWPRSARSPRATSWPAGTAIRASAPRSCPKRTCLFSGRRDAGGHRAQPAGRAFAYELRSV